MTPIANRRAKSRWSVKRFNLSLSDGSLPCGKQSEREGCWLLEQVEPRPKEKLRLALEQRQQQVLELELVPLELLQR